VMEAMDMFQLGCVLYGAPVFCFRLPPHSRTGTRGQGGSFRRPQRRCGQGAHTDAGGVVLAEPAEPRCMCPLCAEREHGVSTGSVMTMHQGHDGMHAPPRRLALPGGDCRHVAPHRNDDFHATTALITGVQRNGY
jgi:hypothetical protein